MQANSSNSILSIYSVSEIPTYMGMKLWHSFCIWDTQKKASIVTSGSKVLFCWGLSESWGLAGDWKFRTAWRSWEGLGFGQLESLVSYPYAMAASLKCQGIGSTHLSKGIGWLWKPREPEAQKVWREELRDELTLNPFLLWYHLEILSLTKRLDSVCQLLGNEELPEFRTKIRE